MFVHTKNTETLPQANGRVLLYVTAPHDAPQWVNLCKCPRVQDEQANRDWLYFAVWFVWYSDSDLCYRMTAGPCADSPFGVCVCHLSASAWRKVFASSASALKSVITAVCCCVTSNAAVRSCLLFYKLQLQVINTFSTQPSPCTVKSSRPCT